MIPLFRGAGLGLLWLILIRTPVSPAQAPTFRIAAMTPAPLSTSAPTLTEILITFNGNVDPASVHGGSVRLIRDGIDDTFNTPDDVMIVPAGLSVLGGNQIRINLTGVTLVDDRYQVRLLGNTPINAGRVAWWRLDETSGPVASDSSGNGNHGTLAGNPSWQPTGGIHGGALNFDGSGDWVRVPRTASLEPAGAITVSLWANITSVSGGFADIVRKAGDVQPGYLVRWHHFDDRLQWRLDRNVNPPVYVADTQVTTPYLSAWHHLAGTYDSATGNSILYVDGAVRNSLAGQTGNLEHTDDFYLMWSNHGGQQALPGRLDDVRVYDRALSALEIQTLASGASDVAVTEPGGAPIDGEFGGAFPSGNGTPGGDFTSMFFIASPGPPPPGGGPVLTNIKVEGCGLLGLEMLALLLFLSHSGRRRHRTRQCAPPSTRPAEAGQR